MEAGISVCSGGIIGLGETEDDRVDMIRTLATLPIHPESVPVNTLVPIAGTPLENINRPSAWEVMRTISTIRIVMPKSRIRLSAGRASMTSEQQALCFLSGANSIFSGEKLLTTNNINLKKDKGLFELLGINGITV
jgi:biotin synthase